MTDTSVSLNYEGLLLKLYSCSSMNAIEDVGKPSDIISHFVTRGQHISTTVTPSIAYNRASWYVDGKEYTSDVGTTFTGYIRPMFAESALITLTTLGTAQLWIDGFLVASTHNPRMRDTLTVEHVFKSSDYIPFVLHYVTSSTTGKDPALILEWSFPSAPAKVIVTSEYFAHSSSETSATLIGPIAAYGKGVFHSDVEFRGDTKSLGSSTIHGALICENIVGLNPAVRVTMNKDKRFLQLTGEGLYIKGTEGSPEGSTERNPLLRISASDGTSGLFGILCDEQNEKYVAVASSQEVTNDETPISAKPLKFSVGQTTVATMREATMTIDVPLFASAGMNISGGDLSVDGDIFTTGHVHQRGKVIIGSPQGGSASASAFTENFALFGDNASHFTGPHFATYTSLDPSPLFQVSSFAHNDVSINFDASYNEDRLLIASSVCAAQISKTANQLAFNYGGKSNAWATAWSLDLTDGTSLFSGKSAVFSLDDSTERGSLRLAPIVTGGNTSICFYRTPNMRTDLDTDYFRLGFIDGVFALTSGGEGRTNPLLSVTADGNLSCRGTFAASGVGNFLSDLTVAGSLFSQESCSVKTLTIRSESKDALQVGGSASFATGVTVGGRLVTGGVSISSKAPRLVFNALQTGPRIILAKSTLPSQEDVAIGTGAHGSLWLAIAEPAASSAYRWMAGNKELMSLNGVGDLVLNSVNGKVVFDDVRTFAINENCSTACVNIGKNWSFRATSGSFILTERASGSLDDPSLDLPVMCAERNASTGEINVNLPVAKTLQLLQGTLMAQNGMFTGNLRSASVSLQGGDNAGICYIDISESLRVESCQDLSTILSKNLLRINCGSDAGEVIVHQGNEEPFSLYYGDVPILVVNDLGCVISAPLKVQNGNINLMNGSLSVEGDQASIFSGAIHAAGGVNIFGTQGLALFPAEQSDGKNSTSQAASASLTYNSAVKSLLVQCAEGNTVIRSQTGIKLDAGKGDVRVSGTLRVRNTALTERGLLLRSSKGSSSSLTTFLTQGEWYYLGKLNTTPNGTGPDESGAVHLQIGDWLRNETIWLRMESGTVKVGLYKITCHYDKGSKVSIYSSRGDFHVFVWVGANVSGGAHLSIKASTFAKGRRGDSMICVSEGSDEFPNGCESSFDNESFICVFDSETAVPVSSRAEFSDGLFTENVSSEGSLTVQGVSQLTGGVVTNSVSTPDDSLNDLLHISSHDRVYITVGEGRVLCNAPIIPHAAGIDIGNETQPFSNATFDGTISSANIKGRTLVIDNEAKVNGPLTLGTNLTAVSGTATFQDVRIQGEGYTEGLFRSTSFVSGGVSCETLRATSQVDILGSLVLKGNKGIKVSSDDDGQETNVSNTLNVQATDILLTDSELTQNTGIRFAADGSIRSLSDITITCGSGQSILLGDIGTRCVSFPGERLHVNGNLKSQGTVHFDDDLFVAGQVHVSGTLHIEDTITLGSVGCIATSPLTSNMSRQSLIEWMSGDHVRISVPDVAETDASLTVTSGGDLILGGTGGITCTKGIGTFAQTNAATVSCGTINIQDRLVIGDSDYSSGITVSPAGDFCLTMGESNVFEVARETHLIKLAGDLVTSGGLDAFAIKIGNRFQMSNDGRATFTDIVGNLAGSISVIAPTGVEASALVISNPSGNLLFQAGKNRGFFIAAVSGNASFQGQVTVESGLDVDTSKSSDMPTAALLVQGGVLVKRSVLIKGSLQLANEDDARFCISAPSTLATDGSSGYHLSLPSSLPSETGQCLVSDKQGQLSWKTLPSTLQQQKDHDDLLRSRRSSANDRDSQRSSDLKYTFAAENNAIDAVVDSFIVAGHSFHVQDFEVTVFCSDNSRQVAVYDMKGIRGATGWQTKIERVLGENVGVEFSLLPNGRLLYSSSPTPLWTNTTFTWDSLEPRNQLSIDRTLFGSDRVIKNPAENFGAFVAVQPARCTRSASASRDARFWAGTHFAQTQLFDDDESAQSGAETFATTVHIADAPKWSANCENSYALVVSKGKSRFGGQVSVQSHLSSQSVGVLGALTVGESLQVGSGTSLQNIQKGELYIGPSNMKHVTFDIIFANPMPDVKYTMVGNAVSADADSSDVFTCTFKSLTRAGCRVTVCTILSDSWTDVTVRVHWIAAL